MTLVRRTYWLLPALVLLVGCGTPYSVTETATLRSASGAASTIERLIVANKVGEVSIIGDSAVTEVSAEVVKIGRGSTPGEAAKALAEIQLTLQPGKNGALEARTEHPGGNSIRQYEVKWRIKAPPSVAVDVRNLVGDVTVRSLQHGAVVSTGVGDIHAEQIRGGLSAHADVGTVKAEAAGKVAVRADVGDAHVRVMQEDASDIRVHTNVGKVVVDLPATRRGALNASTDLGSLDMALDGVSMQGVREHSKHFECTLGGSEQPAISLSADVGDVIVRAYGTPGR